MMQQLQQQLTQLQQSLELERKQRQALHQELADYKTAWGEPFYENEQSPQPPGDRGMQHSEMQSGEPSVSFSPHNVPNPVLQAARTTPATSSHQPVLPVNLSFSAVPPSAPRDQSVQNSAYRDHPSQSSVQHTMQYTEPRSGLPFSISTTSTATIYGSSIFHCDETPRTTRFCRQGVRGY